MDTSNMLEGLLAILRSEKIGIEWNTVAASSSPEAQAMRNEMRARSASSPRAK